MSVLRKKGIGRRYLQLLIIVCAVGGLFGWNVAQASSADTTCDERIESPDATVSELPTEIAIDFAVPLQIRMVRIRVLDAKGKDHAVGAPVVRTDRKRISVRVDRLRIGYFVVDWGVIGADGAVMQGCRTFRIGRPELLSGLTVKDQTFMALN